jgi:hypothetical protein
MIGGFHHLYNLFFIFAHLTCQLSFILVIDDWNQIKKAKDEIVCYQPNHLKKPEIVNNE